MVAFGASGSYYMDRLKSVLSVSVAFFAVVTASAVFFVVAVVAEAFFVAAAVED